MAGLTAIHRKGFKGGGMDASTKSFDASANPDRKGGPIGREDRQSMVGKPGGITQFQADNQGFTPAQIANQNASTPTKEVIEKQKNIYEKQFYDKGQVPPLGSRPIGFGTKINQFNKQKRLNYINYLQKQIRNKLNKGLIDYQEAEGQIQGLTDFDTVQDYIDKVQSVQDLVNKGFYKSDGDFALGKKIPDFPATDVPGVLGIAQDFFAGPVTSNKLNQLNKQLSTLEGLKTTTGLENTNFKNLMEEYQPNRFAREYGTKEPGEDGGGSQQQYIPYLPPEEDVADETTFDYRFGTGQNVGRDVTLGYAANGGRITRAGGGIMNAVPRKGYFIGGVIDAVGDVVGGVAKAAGKVLKSDLGKAAMLYAGGVYLGGGNIFSAGAYNPANFLGKKGYLANIAGKALLKDPTKGFGIKDNLSLTKILGLSAALPFIPGINQAQVDQMPGDDGMRGGRLIDPLTGEEGTPASMRANIENAKIEAGGDPDKLAALNQAYNNMLFSILPYENYGNYAQGGRIKAQEGGLMNLGGMEKDYRNEGGFVPIGKAEKADDVPARLSVNEFVFTADAVRNAGGGDIDKGAEVMENMMKNLENGGRVSEESQGNAGAQQMFSVSERIGEVI